MRLLLGIALIVTTVLSASVHHALYERLLGKSRFHNKTEIEKFILNLQELNNVQRTTNGPSRDASGSSGQSLLEAVGSTEPAKPDQLPYLFEGDIILTEPQINKMIREKQAPLKKFARTPRAKRSITSYTFERWSFPINYWIDISTGVSYTAVQNGIAKWTELTCATFKQSFIQPTNVPSLRFLRGDGCYSYIGRLSDNDTQEVSIGTGCTSLGTVTHEIGHALGFYHEQARPERDNYVTVLGQNIDRIYQSQFTKQSERSTVNFSVEYDYGSVMHYDGYSFSSNGEPTIVPRDANYENTIGQRGEPSFADVKQINFAYCNSSCAGSTLNCKNGGYPDPKNCQVCRCPTGLGGRLCGEVQKSLSILCGSTDLVATTNIQNVTVSGDRDCYYRITSPAGSNVVVTFPTISFPRYYPCGVSYAEVKYRQNPVVTGARICGSRGPSSVRSEGQTMFVFFIGASTSRLSFGYRYVYASVSTPNNTSVMTSAQSFNSRTSGRGGRHTKTTDETKTIPVPQIQPAITVGKGNKTVHIQPPDFHNLIDGADGTTKKPKTFPVPEGYSHPLHSYATDARGRKMVHIQPPDFHMLTDPFRPRGRGWGAHSLNHS